MIILLLVSLVSVPYTSLLPIISSKLLGDRDETNNYVITECSKLAQKRDKSRHDWVAKGIHWESCKKLKFDHTNKWYMHNTQSVLENEMHKHLGFWDTNGSPNLGQTTRPNKNQPKEKKREPAKLWTLLSRLTTE